MVTDLPLPCLRSVLGGGFFILASSEVNNRRNKHRSNYHITVNRENQLNIQRQSREVIVNQPTNQVLWCKQTNICHIHSRLHHKSDMGIYMKSHTNTQMLTLTSRSSHRVSETTCTLTFRKLEEGRAE